jgi:hypothetical protein
MQHNFQGILEFVICHATTQPWCALQNSVPQDIKLQLQISPVSLKTWSILSNRKAWIAVDIFILIDKCSTHQRDHVALKM